MASIQPRTLTTRTGRVFLIRAAQPDDAVPLLNYIRTVAAETEFFILEADEFNFTDEQERQWIQDHFDHPGKIVLVAEASGGIIGSLSFENGPHRRTAHRGTFGVSVATEWRGQGVGTALLRTLLEWAEVNLLIEKVSMEVFATNERAIRLYKRLGFVEEGLRPKEVKLGPGRYVDVLAMYRLVK